MIVLHIAVKPESLGDTFLTHLKNGFPDLNWALTTEASADVLFSTDSDLTTLRGQTVHIRGDESELDLIGKMNDLIMSGKLILPTEQGRHALLGRIHKSVESLRKLRNNNPLLLGENDKVPEEYVHDTHDLAVHLLHGPAVITHAKSLERILASRTYRTLQRVIPSWKPLVPITSDSSINDLYPTLPQSGKDLRERVEAVMENVTELGISPSLSLQDYSQLNLGIPIPGGLHRKSHGLIPPDADLSWHMQFTAQIMMHGLGRAYNEDPSSFHELNTRVGVKVDNYQGPLLNTRSHVVRQTLWSIMLENDNDIFYFDSLPSISASGFRSQSNGTGKTRPSYVYSDLNTVAKSRAIDGEDLNGKSVLKYNSPKADKPDTITDHGEIGARKRYVANVESAQNDALLPVASYIASTKTKLYKALYQQDKDILSRFISNSSEFMEFWEEGYHTAPFIKELASNVLGLNDSQAFLDYVRAYGQRVVCGDVVNYDASATWEFVYPFMETLLSDRALKLAESIYNSDKIGVYTDHRGMKRYYYVTCNDDPSFTPQYSKLVEETRKLMSSLPSGLAITAQGGRGPVVAVLNHIAEQFLVNNGFDKEGARRIISWMPKDQNDSVFCFSTAFMNDGGDDHNLGLLILHICTGLDFDEIEEQLYSLFESYRFLKLEPEFPKMNCGFKFHDDDKGRCIAVSLSTGRMFDNALYPEYPRSAIGLHASVNNYLDHAYGTPDEDATIAGANIIVEDIYGFDSLEHLQSIADAENEYLINNSGEAPARTQIAAFLGVPENDVEWMYTLDDLIDLGVDPDLIEMYRNPIPAELTVDPAKFFNLNTIQSISDELTSEN